MDYDKLASLNDVLTKQFADYYSMIAVGSIVVGDPFIPKRSDHDILLVFQNDIKGDISGLIAPLNFDASYVFTQIQKAMFGIASSKHSFSNLFRSKTLFGKDLVPLSQLPTKEAGMIVYQKGLAEVCSRLRRYIDNSGHKPVEEVRDNFWKQFKHAFMYLAMKEYYAKGSYPCTRKEIVERSKSPELSDVFDVLHSIDQQPKERIVESAGNLLNYLERSPNL